VIIILDDDKSIDAPKQTKEEEPKSIDVLKQTNEEAPTPLEPMPHDVVSPHPITCSSSRGTNIKGATHYALRSLGIIKEETVVVKKP
ncbi:hypothetical protein Tco_0329819, partial [Tanacetum coccineum]